MGHRIDVIKLFGENLLALFGKFKLELSTTPTEALFTVIKLCDFPCFIEYNAHTSTLHT